MNPDDEDSFGMELSQTSKSEGNFSISLNTSETIFTGRDENLAKVEIATLSLILIFCIFGNGLMLIALRKILEYRPMSPMYFFMFKGTDLLCRLVKFLQVFVLYLSTNVVTSMAIDRYLVVCHHNISLGRYYRNLFGPKILVISSYVISFILASPQAFIFSMKDIKETPGQVILDCWVKFEEPWGAKAYVTFFVTFAFAIPMLIICFSYGCICFKVIRYRLPQESKSEIRSTDKDQPPMSSTSNKSEIDTQITLEMRNKKVQRNALQHQISQAKIKTLKLTLAVVVCFFVCWCPFCVTQLATVYSSQNVGPAHVILLLLASLNSCTNPILYLAFSESLCNQLRIFLGLGLKRGSNEDSIGDEARPASQEGIDLPKMNLIQEVPFHTSLGRNSSPFGHCGDNKPETKSDLL
ncbi:Vasopressin V1a receptor [Folsomia candida]|uniref:Vasopressin V1a receptor n=1 Tax=Folsomia candida TaxID=158441 RepID=A0A226F242_FOLCA|nr:Vasopressin V1a receptor [Folsomia candida]